MHDSSFNPDRRAWLLQIGRLLIGGIIGAASLPILVRKASAMAARVYPEGIYKLEGKVEINNEPANVGAIIKTGDIVTTGSKSRAIFIMGKDAFLIRDNSRVEFSEMKEISTGISRAQIHVAGKLLSVFGKSEKTIKTNTAVVGVKGTGIYVESEPDRTYVCLCYGSASIESASNPAIREIINTTHHDSPRYIYGEGSVKTIEKAKMINHTDKELFLLEYIVGRRPPFDEKNEDY